MKKIKNLKQIINVVIIMILIIANILVTFFPQYSKSKISYTELKEKKETITDSEMQLLQNDKELNDQQNTLLETMKNGKIAEEKEKALRENFDSRGLKLHIPSILIDFEQKAILNNIDLIIRYDLMKLSNVETETIPRIVEKEEDLGDTVKKEKVKKEVETETELEDDSGEGKGGTIGEYEVKDKTDSISALPPTINSNTIFNDVLTNNQLPRIQGISTRLLPLEIEGTYENIRSYLQYLDTIDYIEPTYIGLSSNGENLKGIVVLYILYSERGTI